MQGLAQIVHDNEDHGTCRGIVIPNLAARSIVADTCATIVEVTAFGDWTTGEADKFALGYVRGRFDQLRRDNNPATAAFAGALLAQVLDGGAEYVRKLVGEVTGQAFNE